MPHAASRRAFLVAAAAVSLAGWPRPPRRCHEGAHAGHGARARGPHPEPRPGIDASRVASATELRGDPVMRAAFDEVRQIPQVVDGIRCQCGCADGAGMYSLLSCYEGEAMARWCEICQGEGRLAFRLHRAGKSLQEIREAIDARYGA